MWICLLYTSSVQLKRRGHRAFSLSAGTDRAAVDSRIAVLAGKGQYAHGVLTGGGHIDIDGRVTVVAAVETLSLIHIS